MELCIYGIYFSLFIVDLSLIYVSNEICICYRMSLFIIEILIIVMNIFFKRVKKIYLIKDKLLYY